MTDALNGWQPWQSSGDGIYRTRYEEGARAEEEWATSTMLDAFVAYRAAVDTVVSLLARPKGLHWYKNGLHRRDCPACELHTLLRGILEEHGDV